MVEQVGRRLDGLLPGRQGRLLFAYLVINRHRFASRSELVDAIWPDLPPTAGESGLNPLVSKLRRALGPGMLEGRSSLRLNLEAAWVDVEAASEAIHRAESSIAIEDCKRAWGPSQVALFIAERGFLPGDDAPWIDEQRHRLEEIRLRALECYATAGLGIGGTELPAATRAGRQLMALAPMRESGYRVLMRALAGQGNVGEALRVYNQLCNILRDELGVSPSPATRAVYDELILA